MLQGKSIALIIFTVLNAVGVAFLLYVLAQFWKEGHKSRGAARLRTELAAYDTKSRVVEASVLISAETRRDDGRVVQFPIRGESGQQHTDRNPVAGRTSKASRSVAR
jgi:hypothetical protein